MNHQGLLNDGSTENVQQQSSSGDEESNHPHSSFALPRQAAFAMLLAMGTALMPAAANAGPLSSPTRTPLTLPASCPGAPGCGSTRIGVLPTVTNHNNNTFDGNWPSIVDPPWQGSFNGTGSYPGRNGTVDFNFSGLTGPVVDPGTLAAGTFFILGDLDNGSGPEHFTLRAQDASGFFITGPTGWLNDAIYVSSLNPGDFISGSMPWYSYDSATGIYKFDGLNVAGNPTISVWLTTNVDVGFLHFTGDTPNASFSLAAPTPEPGSLLLMGSGIVGLAGLARRRWLS